MNRLGKRLTLAFFMIMLASQIGAIELTPTTFDLELQKVRYENTLSESLGSFEMDQFEDEFRTDGFTASKAAKRKSPGKAFLMSFLVPGLGQYYNGSKIKAASFLGLEVVGWVFNRKLDSKGNDLQAEFEAFNRDNWQRERYDTYAEAVGSDTTEGFSHDLPETRTQQYYEMTGKYDQFAWGWTDARIDSVDIDSLIILGTLPIVKPSVEGSVPYSADRDTYEQMRYDSNQEFKSARRIASLILVNHLVSGLEAFFSARSHNKNVQSAGGQSKWTMKAGLKSYYAVQDTPYFRLSFKF